jgi:ATP phosphoribosyltransferase
LIVSSPPPIARKRAASSSPEKPSSRRHRKPRNAEVGTDIAAALRDVAGSLRVVGSPEARMRAVEQMEDDDEFSDNESVTIMRLFTLDSAVAQTYTASKKKSTRTAFVRGSVEAAQRKGIL